MHADGIKSQRTSSGEDQKEKIPSENAENTHAMASKRSAKIVEILLWRILGHCTTRLAKNLGRVPQCEKRKQSGIASMQKA
jgi:hypothetical protein